MATSTAADAIAGYDGRIATIERARAEVDAILAELAGRLMADVLPEERTEGRLAERDRLRAARSALAEAVRDLARYDDAIQSRRVLKGHGSSRHGSGASSTW